METIGIEPPTSRGNSPQSGLSPRAVPQLAVTGPPDELFVATQHKTPPPARSRARFGASTVHRKGCQPTGWGVAPATAVHPLE